MRAVSTPDLAAFEPFPSIPGTPGEEVAWQQVRDALSPDLRAFLESIKDE